MGKARSVNASRPDSEPSMTGDKTYKVRKITSATIKSIKLSLTHQLMPTTLGARTSSRARSQTHRSRVRNFPSPGISVGYVNRRLDTEDFVDDTKDADEIGA